MRIGIDVDDTITNSYKDIIKEISRYYHKDFNELLSRKMTYHDFFENDEFPNYNAFAFERYKHIVDKVEIKDNAVKIINKLHDDGNEIVIITARHYGEYDDPYTLTFNYLFNHQVKFDKIIVNKMDKAQVCVDEKIDLFIDDSVENCRKVKDVGIKVLLFDALFNQDNNEFKRVHDWEDVYDIINKK